uniref:Coat protein n=1 Tax=Citrus yellow vein clearing virus TaxID=1214459 RepID=A0A288QY29_9VIRU|nr:coat protein [Citrus yellow vein clearing virus]
MSFDYTHPLYRSYPFPHYCEFDRHQLCDHHPVLKPPTHKPSAPNSLMSTNDNKGKQPLHPTPPGPNDTTPKPIPAPTPPAAHTAAGKENQEPIEKRITHAFHAEAKTHNNGVSPPAFNPNNMNAVPLNLLNLNLRYSPVTNSIANPKQTEAIGKAWVRILNIDPANVFLYAIDLARACADAGSSPEADIIGANEDLNPVVERNALALVVRDFCPLRAFCAYYSRVVWNLMIKADQPPANWMKSGVDENAKFAAFDFFHGILSPASLYVPLERHPTSAERIANQAMFAVKIANAPGNGTDLTMDHVAFTKGRTTQHSGLRPTPFNI